MKLIARALLGEAAFLKDRAGIIDPSQRTRLAHTAQKAPARRDRLLSTSWNISEYWKSPEIQALEPSKTRFTGPHEFPRPAADTVFREQFTVLQEPNHGPIGTADRVL